MAELLKAQFPAKLNDGRAYTTNKHLISLFYNRLFNLKFQRFMQKKGESYGKSFN